MPDPTTSGPATPEESRLVAEMLAKILDAIGDIAAEPTAAVPPGLWQPLHDAHLALGDPERLRLAFGNPDAPTDLTDQYPIEWAVSLLLNPDSTLLGSLGERGFSGPLLQFHLAVFNHTYVDYVAHGRVKDIPKNDEHWLRKGSRFLRRFLSAGATVTDSLAAIPPLGVVKIPSELCSLVCDAIDARFEEA